jgi:hypothetical protein
MRASWLVGLIVVVGCTQEHAARVSSAPTAPAAGVDERDALWALAPEAARFGVVASPRGSGMLVRGALAVQDLLASSADFATVNAELMHALMTQLGSLNPTLAGFGLTADRGAAMFVAEGGRLVLVLPVVDRD